MKKYYLIAVVPFILGISCFIAFNIIGDHIAADGTLVEPFALIPIAFLMFAIGIILSIVLVIKSFLRKK